MQRNTCIRKKHLGYINFVKINSNYIRVCRDDIRSMLNNYKHDDKTEVLVTKIIKCSVITALKNNYNVIIDETSCNNRTFKMFC